MKPSQDISGSQTSKGKNGAYSKHLTKSSLKEKRYKKAYWCKGKLAHLMDVDLVNRTINGPYQKIEEVPVPERYYFRRLIKMGFNAQLSLF